MPGIYVSYPFCAQKCTFCNFASEVFHGDAEALYLAALEREIAAFEWPWTPETLYLGGGTPSRIQLAALERLFDLIPGRPWKEATIEAAPGGLTPELAAGWRRLGITRVSLGVQSFVPREIARTGRKHTPERVAEEVALLRAAGIENFNIDLIAGLSGQTPASWRESLDWVERLAAPHVSVYMLEVDPDSRLGGEILRHGNRYGAAEAPSEDLTADLYETAIDRLERLGILQYEISNFARPGFASLHNLKYWRLEPYAGFGADAHSLLAGLRHQNVESPAEYIARGGLARVETTPACPAEERFFVGLRLREGVLPTSEEWLAWEAPIRRHLESGLLERHGPRLRLTRRGVLLSNEVLQDFVKL